MEPEVAVAEELVEMEQDKVVLPVQQTPEVVEVVEVKPQEVQLVAELLYSELNFNKD